MNVQVQSANKYRKINAFTHKPDPLQIATVALHMVQLSIEVLAILPAIVPYEIISSVAQYTSLTAVVVLYLYLSLTDPVDKGVYSPSQPSQSPATITHKYCQHCKCQVALSSKHCFVCGRCCYDFDHHCRFLNNCIGGRNYKAFVVLLVVCICYQSLCLYRCATVLSISQDRTPLYSIGQRLARRVTTIVSIVIACSVLLFLVSLMLFHLMLRCILSINSYKWIKSASATKPTEISYEANRQLIQTANKQLRQSRRLRFY